MKNIFLIVFLLLINSCKSQHSKPMIPKINSQPEMFSEINFERLIDKNQFVKRGFLSGNTYIEIYTNNDGKITLETPTDSYFSIYKEFYNNKSIKQKGLQFNLNTGSSFLKGSWYEFDESGKLIKETDYDKPFKFTFEDILKLCEKENITVDKGPILQSTGWHTTISRGLENNHPYWSIEWLKKPDILEKITLDGITGKVVSRTERQYINN